MLQERSERCPHKEKEEDDRPNKCPTIFYAMIWGQFVTQTFSHDGAV